MTQSIEKENFGLPDVCAIVVSIGLLGGGVLFAAGSANRSVGLPFGGSSKLERIDSPNHPIAIAVGCAEGTRVKGGGFTKAYQSHKDPGDGKTNGGTFSAAARGNGITESMTPEERDQSFLANINQAIGGIEKQGLNLSREELAHFVDLKVQAHPDVSKQFAKAVAGKSSPIVEARVGAYYFDGKLQAAGFGNSKRRLKIDQQRRFDRISECLS